MKKGTHTFAAFLTSRRVLAALILCASFLFSSDASRTSGGQARVELRQRDFWFPIKDSPEPDADREMWHLNMAENKGATCTFTLPKMG